MVTHNVHTHRFELHSGRNDTPFIEYIPTENGMIITRTWVPRILEGLGIASMLTRHVLDYARERELRIVPACSFTQVYLKRHPEYAGLVEEEEMPRSKKRRRADSKKMR
ncbi:GNAT family N-acetyltransferase [uncultured Alistipes sp.]|uniref:GNAT family N-acetyltransferase n=1 Tax=uncultured Alistipes sp. TaxID=538949 RepID=UPI002621D939|nr:GNAT family N-acetyltransferase [uncultured Alistipes sp.]